MADIATRKQRLDKTFHMCNFLGHKKRLVPVSLGPYKFFTAVWAYHTDHYSFLGTPSLSANCIMGIILLVLINCVLKRAFFKGEQE